MSEEATFDEIGEDLFDDLGQEATFTPSVGDAVSCQVHLYTGTENQPIGLDAQVWGSETTIEYQLDEVGKEADAGETFLIGSTTYTVKHVVENSGRFVTVAVK